MNTQSILHLLSLSLAIHLAQADDPKSGYHGMAGPNGGRLLVEAEPHIELLVKIDTKKVEIRFVGDALTVLPPSGQEVTLSVGEGASATTLTFSQQGDKLVSDASLPAGDQLHVTVKIRSNPEVAAVTAEKFILDLSPCPTGKHLRYACTCKRDQQASPEEQKQPSREQSPRQPGLQHTNQTKQNTQHEPMKSKLTITLLALALAFSANAADKDKHDHEEHTAKAGPTGGRLITEVEPHVEFFVTKDKKVELRFVNDDNKVVAPGEQVITVTMGDRSTPTKLSFTKDGDKLISDKAIPEGNDLPTVVQIKAKAGEKSVTEKFNLNLNKCPTCSNAEYACTCAHGEDEKKK